MRACLLAALLIAACDSPDEAATTEPQTNPGKADDPSSDPRSDDFTGVVPDFAPSRGVVIHRLLVDLAPDFRRSLLEALGHDRVVELTTGFGGPSAGWSRATSLVWTRDFMPHTIEVGGVTQVLAYLSPDPARSGFTNEAYVPVAPPGEDMKFYRDASGAGEWRKTETMPLLSEGGNVVATGRWLIVTDRLVRDNEAPQSPVTAAMRAAGFKARTLDQTLDLFSRYTRTARDRIVVLPPMPGEKTDHADLVVMALGPNEVMVPELGDDILEVITYGHEIELAWRVRAYLDEVAGLLEGRGLQVSRLPMLAPVYLLEDGREVTGWNAVVYSPANALQVHFAGEAPRVWLPTFSAPGFPERYVALAHAYEDLWTDFFEGRGFVVHAVDATALGHAYGLFHCVTAPLF